MAQRIWADIQDSLELLVTGDHARLERWFGEPNGQDSKSPTLPDRTTNEHVSSELYEYSSLNGDAHSIRLLELLPGTRQDDIACNLTEIRLDECHQGYDALSYVWGEASGLTPILVNGRTLMARPNLRAALFNIRKLDQPCTLWVDAVCIDQTNVAERNHQVSFMGDVYRYAARTIVWLGNSHPRFTRYAYAMVEELATEALALAQQPSKVNNFDQDTGLTMSLLDMQLVESPLSERYRDDATIIHLAYASWWFRCWTVQEVLLASKAVVMAGKYTIDWERFCAGIDHGLAIGIWNPMILGIIVQPIILPHLSMHILRRQRRRHSHPLGSFQPPASATAQCRFRKASDPRDKIYALLGLKDVDPTNHAGAALGIDPDYALSVEEVYTHAARQLIQQSGTLNLLGACSAKSSTALPSWVPDWSVGTAAQPAPPIPTTPRPQYHTPQPHADSRLPVPLMHDALGRPRLTHATRHAPPSSRFPSNTTTTPILALTGLELTPITALAPLLHRLHFDDQGPPDPRALPDTLFRRLSRLGRFCVHLVRLYWSLSGIVPHLATFWDWEAFARERAAPPANPDPGVGGAGMFDPLAVYWQTLCVGTEAVEGVGEAGEGRRAMAGRFYAWRASLGPILEMHRWRVDSLFRPLAFVGYLMRTWKGYSEFARYLEAVYERRLGRGENGYLMLLPAETQVGDRLVLVQGGMVPLVLRREGDMYRFVGEAYVHGIMDGEAYEEEKCAEMKIR